MKNESGTHRSMGKKGSLGSGLESGVAEVMPVKSEKDSGPDHGRQKPKKNGSISV